MSLFGVIMKQFDTRNISFLLIRGTVVCANLELLFSRAFIGNMKNTWFSSSLE